MGEPTDTGAAPTGAARGRFSITSRGGSLLTTPQTTPPCGGSLGGCPRPGEGGKRTQKRGRHYIAGVRTYSGVAPGAGELRPKGV